MDDVFSYLDCMCEFGGSAFFRNERSGYSMKYRDILEERNLRISCYLYIYLHT
jgi:hypothetical protein